MASDHRARGRLSGRSLLVILVALLIVSPLGQAGARRIFATKPGDSPAINGSQVTTQGISDLPDGQIVYRVVKRTAPARGGAKVGRRVLSIVLATDDPVLLSNERADGTIEDIARIAPGESYLVQDGTRQIRSSLTTTSVDYLAVEIVSEANGPKIGNGELLFLSDPFTAPVGPRDIDFVRNVLNGKDTGIVPDSGNNVAILATDGAIDILPANGKVVTLQAGESATFPSGELEIQAATPTANGVPTNQLAGLTSSLQAGPTDAAYVVTVIGEEVPATGVTPSPTRGSGTTTLDPAPTATRTSAGPGAAPSPTASSTPSPLGTIGAGGEVCPGQTDPTRIDLGSCTAITDGYSVSISGGGKTFTLADAVPSDGGFYWIGIPLGSYAISVDALPSGYDAYLIVPESVVGGSQTAGYTITVDEVSPAKNFGVVFYSTTPPTPTPTPAPVGVTVNLTFSECDGYGEAQGPIDCAPVPYGSVNQPYLVRQSDKSVIVADMATVNGNVYTWTGLPAGGYLLYVTDSADALYINGSYLPAGQTYGIGLSELPFNLDVYAIRPPVIV